MTNDGNRLLVMDTFGNASTLTSTGTLMRHVTTDAMNHYSVAYVAAQ